MYKFVSVLPRQTGPVNASDSDFNITPLGSQVVIGRDMIVAILAGDHSVVVDGDRTVALPVMVCGTNPPFISV